MGEPAAPFEHLRVPGIPPPTGIKIKNIPGPTRKGSGPRVEEKPEDDAMVKRILDQYPLVEGESVLGGGTHVPSYYCSLSH